MKKEEEKERLRYLMKWRRDLLDYVGGAGNFVQAMAPKDNADLTRLAKKFYFDPEFNTTLEREGYSHSPKSAHTRSRRR